MPLAPSPECPFCQIIGGGARHLVAENETAVAFEDAYPLAEGHTLVVPRRHVANPLELDEQEWLDLHSLARAVALQLQSAGVSTAFNIGSNCGDAAGQTIGHAHLHVIPRRGGDHPDPRGGIRAVLPVRAAYWELSE